MMEIAALRESSVFRHVVTKTRIWIPGGTVVSLRPHLADDEKVVVQATLSDETFYRVIFLSEASRELRPLTPLEELARA